MPSDPQRSRARKHLRTRDAIPLDEVEADFGMKGMLSFLQIPREEATRNLAARRAVDLTRDRPMGHSGAVASIFPFVTILDSISSGVSQMEPPMGHSPGSDQPRHIAEQLQVTPPAEPTQVDRLAISLPVRSSVHPGRLQPEEISDFKYSVAIPDVGNRKPFRWTIVQDAHTAAEQNMFSAMMELARKQGPKLADGSSLVEASLTDLQKRLRTDHKQVKKLLGNLIEKHAIALDRVADQARQQPTRYRIFSFRQIIDRRRSLGLLWVVKNRGVRLLSDDLVQHLWRDTPMGQTPIGGDATLLTKSPMGNKTTKAMGRSPRSPMGHTPEHILIEEEDLRTERKSTTTTFLHRLRNLFDGDCDVQLAEMIWRQAFDAAVDISEDEVIHFAMKIYRKARQNPRVQRPQSIVVTTIAGHIRAGGLQELRAQLDRQTAEIKREQEDVIEFWKGIANDPAESHESRDQARSMLRDYGIVVDA